MSIAWWPDVDEVLGTYRLCQRRAKKSSATRRCRYYPKPDRSDRVEPGSRCVVHLWGKVTVAVIGERHSRMARPASDLHGIDTGGCE